MDTGDNAAPAYPPPIGERVADLKREQAIALFAALAHPTRLRTVELLLRGEKTVGEIADALAVPQSGTSQHLSILTRAGVLVVEPRGTARIYRVRGPRIAQLLALVDAFFEVHGLYPLDALRASPGETATARSAPASL